MPSMEKYTSIKVTGILDCPPDRLIAVGDSSMDLSMRVEDSTFIGFNPQRETAIKLLKSRNNCCKFKRFERPKAIFGS